MQPPAPPGFTAKSTVGPDGPSPLPGGTSKDSLARPRAGTPAKSARSGPRLDPAPTGTLRPPPSEAPLPVLDPNAPPPLSPAYVKATISALTASRRNLTVRLDRISLFDEIEAKRTDPIEVQLLFAARDTYLTSTGKDKIAALAVMARLVAQLRNEGSGVASEMNRLMVAAMQSEVAQKKIDAALAIARSRGGPAQRVPTLADLIDEAGALPAEPPSSADAEPVVILEDGEARPPTPEELQGAK